MRIASAIHLALGAREVAAAIMHEIAGALDDFRRTLHQRLSDPELMLRRIQIDFVPHMDLAGAGARLREDQLWTRARAVMIEAGCVNPGSNELEFESVQTVGGIVFQSVVER